MAEHEWPRYVPLLRAERWLAIGALAPLAVAIAVVLAGGPAWPFMLPLLMVGAAQASIAVRAIRQRAALDQAVLLAGSALLCALTCVSLATRGTWAYLAIAALGFSLTVRLLWAACSPWLRALSRPRREEGSNDG